MPVTVEIDSNSGFCGGVIRAIRSAEDYLRSETCLYSLGAIVHNEAELERLSKINLKIIDNVAQLSDKPGATMLIRAHGEPPQTYTQAKLLGLSIIDCTCPVVLQLQKNIREAGERLKASGGQLIIFGKVGHAEVLGLLGQTEGRAIVIENMEMLLKAIENKRISLNAPTEVFSQTTKSPSGYSAICSKLKELIPESLLNIHNTICSQVASRHAQLSSFATDHDAIVFVAGKDSSNGKVLLGLCKSLNPRTFHISSIEDLQQEWFKDGDRVGVCGATSTPKWLLESVSRKILKLI